MAINKLASLLQGALIVRTAPEQPLTALLRLPRMEDELAGSKLLLLMDDDLDASPEC